MNIKIKPIYDSSYEIFNALKNGLTAFGICFFHKYHLLFSSWI